MSTSTSRASYHHGDLRAALIAAAIESLEAGEAFSMRAVAHRAGVSPTAPYRHFADRGSLDAAVAVEGFERMREGLRQAAAELPEGADAVDEITALGVAYVSFALQRPAMFRLMFGNECDDANSERVQASQGLHAVLEQTVVRLFPAADPTSLSTALWGLAHGLAFLHLDGKLRPEPGDEVAGRVRASVAAILALPGGAPTGRTSDRHHPSGARP
ncbi:TetR/AcrR family transcriptional regulator [Promicromonospora sp. NFX87]|uniref:TetR/AcrR family transcriptional regulator n=1 Tax=Promicromonospora sp. NFX87 TaxID=3402691 RepID=UPI003AFB1566